MHLTSMKTYHARKIEDLAASFLDRPDANASALLEPLFALENPSLIAHRRDIAIDGEEYEIPKILLLGKRGGGVPIRVGLFAGLDAGLDAGRLETVAAAASFLLQGAISPALAADFAIFGYPIVNAAGFGAHSTSHRGLQERWRTSPDAEDVQLFRSEFRRVEHHGIITFRSAENVTAFTANVRSKLTAHEVVAPALRTVASLVPVADDPVRVLPTNLSARRADHAAGRLLPDPETRPWPFEIEIFAPASVSPEKSAQALVLATFDILKRYRRFICHGGEL